eukprot:scaffold1397_cov254-Pinguiococcus_pyrenoidosus.AAC.52
MISKRRAAAPEVRAEEEVSWILLSVQIWRQNPALAFNGVGFRIRLSGLELLFQSSQYCLRALSGTFDWPVRILFTNGERRKGSRLTRILP